jgi:CheY-like chemotaxis protein
VRILFVENHPEFTASVIQSFLVNDEVVVAPSITAAKSRIGESRFDVVLVDYDLDDGKGDEFVRWLRASRADSKIVAVSAREIGNDALLAAGADTSCAKLGFSQIETVLRELLGPAPSRPRIYADFNGLMESPRDATRSMVPLDTWGSLRDLSNAGIRLREGMRLVIHDASDEVEDLEADVTTFYDPERRWWFAELERALAYVPAHDRSPVTTFLCLGCRADLGSRVQGAFGAMVQGSGHCPHCGVSTTAAIAPP